MEEQTFGHESFISPFTWRYGTEQMRRLWSETHKRTVLRSFWVALARAEMQAGIVTAEQVEDLESQRTNIDIARASEIEAEIHHDLMAEIKTYAQQCPIGGSVIHLGATSMDALDNMDAIRLIESMDLIIAQTRSLLQLIADLIIAQKDTPCMAFTHIQPAEPTTIGYRLAQYGQDILMDLQELLRVRKNIRGKGLKGAVGTSASYTELLTGTGMSARELESLVMEELGIEAFTAATQVYPRKQDWLIGNALAGLGGSLYKMAFDLRILQSPPMGEWAEPFGSKQVGSSAMPFKRNPIRSEKIDSLARFLAHLPNTLWHNAAHTLLERTLDDSANRREVFPAAFLSLDEILKTAIHIVSGLQFRTVAIERNLRTYGVFAATERLLMELGRRGADRQEMHEVIREHSLIAWDELQSGREPKLGQTLTSDPRVTAVISADEAIALLDASVYVGDAPGRAEEIAQQIRAALG
ncbi:MAG: adenylosuccinate lyase [Spirochaetia bacterium]|nr:adenylosuccinate lyase [Spirochaetia bacterium]MCF7940669.1 adenylosuccinate lyase [Spirochaetia bacterium]